MRCRVLLMATALWLTPIGAVRAGPPASAPAADEPQVAAARALLLRADAATPDGKVARLALLKMTRAGDAWPYDCLADPDPALRRIAVRQITGFIHPRAKPAVFDAIARAIPQLLEIIRDRSSDDELRTAAVATLSKATPDGLTATYRLLATDDEVVQSAAVATIAAGRWPLPALSPEQRQALADVLPAIADRMARLGNAGKPRTGELLLVRQADPSLEQLRAVPKLLADPEYARLYLHDAYLRQGGMRRMPIEFILTYYGLAAPSERERVIASEIDRRSGDEWLAELKPYLQGPDPTLRRAAVAVLARSGGKPTDEMAQELQAMPGNGDPEAQAALGRTLCNESREWFAGQATTAICGGPVDAARAMKLLQTASAAQSTPGFPPNANRSVDGWPKGGNQRSPWSADVIRQQAVYAADREVSDLRMIGPVRWREDLRTIAAKDGDNGPRVRGAGPLEEPVITAWAPATPPARLPAATSPTVSIAAWLLVSATLALVTVVIVAAITCRWLEA